MNEKVKIALISLGIFLEAFIFLICFYFTLAFFGTLIPVNSDFQNDGEHEVWVMSNGLHTDVVLPIDHTRYDWRQFIDLTDYEGGGYHWIAFGWGDQDVYLNTPTWNEVDVSDVMRSLFLPTTSLVHVTLKRSSPKHATKSVKLNISDEQYDQLVAELHRRFDLKGEMPQIIANKGYGPNDNFYRAQYDYSMLYTCNNWTNGILKSIGVRGALWAPLQVSVFYQLEQL